MTKRRSGDTTPADSGAPFDAAERALADALVEILMPKLRAILAAEVAARARVQSSDTDTVLTTRELLKRIPLNRSTIWRMVREGRFPAPIQLTAARIGWRWSTVAAWLAERERHRVAARSYFGKRQ